METGVWDGLGFATTKSTLIGPVQSTVRVGVTALTAHGDARQWSCETVQNQNDGGDDRNHCCQAQVELVVYIGSLEGVSFCSEEAGEVEDVEEGHIFCLEGTENFSWIKRLF